MKDKQTPRVPRRAAIAGLTQLLLAGSALAAEAQSVQDTTSHSNPPVQSPPTPAQQPSTPPAQSPTPVPAPTTAPMPLAYDYIASPNFDERPTGAAVSCIVLHSTVEPTTEGTIKIFLNDKQAGRVSAHFVVGKDGRVVQMVPIEKRAWHAGKSVLNGQGNVNHFSVGIEMVNLNDGNDPYPEEQYRAVAGIIRFIRSRFDIPDDHIVSHETIALPAGRKTDPKGFDFAKVCDLARVSPAIAPVTATGAQEKARG